LCFPHHLPFTFHGVLVGCRVKLRPGSENTAFMVYFSVGLLSTLEHIYKPDWS